MPDLHQYGGYVPGFEAPPYYPQSVIDFIRYAASRQTDPAKRDELLRLLPDQDDSKGEKRG